MATRSIGTDPAVPAAPPGAPGSGLRHVTALDGLRGAAVIGVIAFHADLLTGGYLGVDLFFVLSGYLITSLLLHEHRRTGAIDLAAFWTRRARRLLPAIGVLIAVLAVVTIGATAGERTTFGADAIATLLYTANWRAVLSGNEYWAQFAAPSPLEHTWSLAIEEQFYLVWPLVTIVVLGHRRAGRVADPDGRRGARRLLVASLGGAAVSTALMIGWSLAGVDPNRLYLGTDTRAGAILLGAALACVSVLRTGDLPVARRPTVAAAGWAGVAILVVAWIGLPGRSPWLYRGGFVVCALAGLAIIASVTWVGDGRLARLLSWRPLTATGLVSYGLYLWHWPVFVWLDEARTGWSGVPLLALQLAVTVGITLLSYRFVEMPVRRGVLRPRPALAACAAVVAILVVTVAAARPSGPVVDAASAAESIEPLGPLGGAAAPRLLVLGDSVAASAAEGVLPFQAEFGVEARSDAVPGCGIARTNPTIRYPDGTEADETACLGTVERWGTLVGSWKPDAVLVVLGWPGQTDRWVEGAWRRPCDPVFDEWYLGEVTAALDAIGATGASLAVATAPYYRPPISASASDAGTDCVNRSYRSAAAAASVPIVDLADHLCPAGTCAIERDGVALRPDGLHFEGAASVWMADWMLHEQWRTA